MGFKIFICHIVLLVVQRKVTTSVPIVRTRAFHFLSVTNLIVVSVASFRILFHIDMMCAVRVQIKDHLGFHPPALWHKDQKH